MIIVVDTSLSVRIAQALDALLSPAHHVIHTSNISAKSDTDSEIRDHLEANATALYLVQDLDIINHPHRMAGLRELNCHIAFLTEDWLETRPDEHPWMIMRVMPRLLNKLLTLDKPATYQITPGPNPHIRLFK